MIYIISSFPRSGNTWLRLILTELFLIKENQNNNSHDLLYYIKRYIPDLHCDDINSNIHLQNRFFKTHDKITNINVYFDKCILLFRKPEDCILSYFYYMEARGDLSSMYINDKERFANYFIHKWVDYHNSFINSSLSYFLISYEDLLSRTALTLINLFDKIDVVASEYEITNIIEKTKFSVFKGSWAMSDTRNPNHAFFRNGITGGGENEFSKDCLHYIREVSDDTYMKLLQKHNLK